ncbi:MAG: hypothetical protein JWN48_1376 [Myxococcaceae bacterium]|nr:hypothetical protein [Myxococcaceae bacterium]
MSERQGLRIAMLTTFYPPYNFGGDGVYVQRLARALVRRGHQVEVLHETDAYHVGGGTTQAAPPAEPGIRVHALRTRLPLVSTLATQQLGRPLVHGAKIQRILARGFDVIHYHNVSLLGGPALLSMGQGIKLYTAHEHWLVCPTHILWRHNREPCPARECLKCVTLAGRPVQLWRYGNLLQHHGAAVDAFLALSAFSAHKHAEFGFPFPMQVVPSFLPDDADAVPPPHRPDAVSGSTSTELPYFLFVGRLERIKGLDDVLPLFEQSLPAQLWIAGQGSEEARLRALCQGRPQVRFLGSQTPEQLRALYRGAVALIAPSRCFEVFPLVLLEAFQQGTPVIARRLGPYPELLQQSGGGLLFSTAEELRSALLRMLASTEERAAMGRLARAAQRALWSEDQALHAYHRVVRDIARRRGMASVVQRIDALDPQAAASPMPPTN